MADYHFVYKDLEGTSTQWDDIQRKLGNLPEKPPAFKPPDFTPADDEDSLPKDKSWIDSKTHDELEDLEDDFDDDRFLEDYRRKRLEEMKQAAKVAKFGSIMSISGSDFIREVSQAPPEIWVVCLLYKEGADVEKYLTRDKEVVVIGHVDERDLDEAIERKEEPDELFFRSSEDIRREAHEYATAAISYMRKKGHNLELVKPCLFNSGVTGMGIITHFNFKALRADDPSAPVETYFGQVHVDDDDSAMVVECCVSLGASDSLPYKRDNRGCQYCYHYVHHPEGGCEGIIWGRLTLSPKKSMLVLT